MVGLLKLSATRQENASACNGNGAADHAHIRNSVITDRRRESSYALANKLGRATYSDGI